MATTRKWYCRSILRVQSTLWTLILVLLLHFHIFYYVLHFAFEYLLPRITIKNRWRQYKCVSSVFQNEDRCLPSQYSWEAGHTRILLTYGYIVRLANLRHGKQENGPNDKPLHFNRYKTGRRVFFKHEKGRWALLIRQASPLETFNNAFQKLAITITARCFYLSNYILHLLKMHVTKHCFKWKSL